MAGKVEEKGSMKAAKSEKDAVPSTKRDAVAEQDEPASFDPFGSQSRAAAIDNMLQDAIRLKQAAGGAGPNLTRRLTKGEIRSIIALKPEPFPSADYLDELGEFDPLESIAEKKLRHAQDAAYFGDRDEKYEAFRQEVIRGLKEKGYYEVDVEYIARREKANEYVKQHVRNPFGFLTPDELRHHAATPEQEQRWRREGCYGEYVADEEEELLISYGEDDDSMSDEEDSDADDEQEDAEAQGHEGPPVQSN